MKWKKFKHLNEILGQSLILNEYYTSGASSLDTSYTFNVPEDICHVNKWLYVCVLIEHSWSRYIIFNGEKIHVKLCSTLFMTDAYTVKRMQNYPVIIILSNYFPYLRLTLFIKDTRDETYPRSTVQWLCTSSTDPGTFQEMWGFASARWRQSFPEGQVNAPSPCLRDQTDLPRHT